MFYLTHLCIFFIQKLKNKHTFLKNIQTEKAEESLGARTLCFVWYNCTFYYSKIEKETHFPKKVYKLKKLILSPRDSSAFSVCILFEENVFIFQFLNDEIHSYVLFDIIVHSKIEK